MKTAIAITDLTRMQQGRVCIAGYDKDYRCIRPVLPPPGIPEGILMQNGRLIIYPFSIVEFDLLGPTPQPPHTEDTRFDPTQLSYLRNVRDREKLLDQTLFPSVADIFEQPISRSPGFSVEDCKGPRSIGTILPKNIHKVIYAPEQEGGAWDYRLHFYDHAGEYYRLKITDLTWHHYCNSLRARGMEQTEITEELTRMLRKKKVYLRIGLARGWKEHPGRCFLQLNAIHTRPDYLEGKTFQELRN